MTQQYKEAITSLIANGVESSNRTTMPTRKVWGGNMRFDLSEGIPLNTTRYNPYKSTIVELIWLLQGDTNTKFLNDNGCKFWDEWALTEEHINRVVPFSDLRGRSALLQELQNEWTLSGNVIPKFTLEDWDVLETMANNARYDAMESYYAEKVSDAVPRITYADLGFKVGDLGPVYGKMWRAWPLSNGGTRDQIAEVEWALRNKPNSRRIIVSSWNPEFLPDESISPHDNVLNGKQALPPCHTLFQFGTIELTYEERIALAMGDTPEAIMYRNAPIPSEVEDIIKTKRHPAGYLEVLNPDDLRSWRISVMDTVGIPKYRLNSKLYCRSNDMGIGNPANVFSYSIMTCMLAHVHNMVPGVYEHAIGDQHFYVDQLECLQEQMTRNPITPLPRVRFKRKPTSITEFTIDDIEIIDYQYHPAIKFPRPAV